MWVLLVFGALVFSVVMINRLYLGDRKASEWPVSLKEPLSIPNQADFNQPDNSGQHPEAAQIWSRALQTFRSAASDEAAIEQAAPLLKTLWLDWPNTKLAVKAELFYIETLSAYGVDKFGYLQSQSYVERALRTPRWYFSNENKTSTQAVAVRVILALIDNKKHSQAWQLCIKFRWLAPRIDLVGPVCQDLINDFPDIVRSPESTLRLIPSGVPGNTIPAEKLSLSLVKAVQQYLSSPYDADRLTQAIMELYKAGFDQISNKLILELLQIDLRKVPKVEGAIAQLKAAKN